MEYEAHLLSILDRWVYGDFTTPEGIHMAAEIHYGMTLVDMASDRGEAMDSGLPEKSLREQGADFDVENLWCTSG